jgi:hypothetical protein
MAQFQMRSWQDGCLRSAMGIAYNVYVRIAATGLEHVSSRYTSGSKTNK